VGLRDALAGRRVFVTGVTGFVGEALLERLLADFPDTEVSVLIRPRAGSNGRRRLESLLRKPAFSTLRETATIEELADRITVVEGDLGAVPDLPADLDVVVHCAGEVSFDPAIDEGFTTNVYGTAEVLRAARARGARPHFVHVSTAYVAGLRTGFVPEGRLDHLVDWRAEAAAAARQRARIEDESRSGDLLDGFLKEARREHGKTGYQAVAKDAEQRRRRWVDKQLVAAGRERARSLGWTDCYTFTKAMGERLLEEQRGDVPLSVVRPSIIESALQRPAPGWIEGFKMAEPIILAYGRGELPDFPAAPDGTIDIIPVDLVVNAILAVMATPPPPDPIYYQVCSGSSNPLLFQDLYRIVRGYFERKPLVKRDRGEIGATTWRFAGAATLDRQLRLGERAVDLADRALRLAPRSSRTRATFRELDRADAKLRFLRRYTELYKPYTQALLTFDDTNTRRLAESLSPEDAAAFPTDCAIFSWEDYLPSHCEGITAGLRAMSKTPSRPKASRPALEPRQDVVAIFDLDGTLMDSNIIESYLWLRLTGDGQRVGADRVREIGSVARELPRYLTEERRDRAGLIRAVYERYAGSDPEELARIVDDDVSTIILGKVHPAAIRRVREHRAAGHRTVLLTGAVEVLTRPLRPLFDDIVTARLTVGPDGRHTGRLASAPLVGEARAAWISAYARAESISLPHSYAYADSQSDLPMLRAVGHPIAVNPDLAVLKIARKAGWQVEEWSTGSTGPSGTSGRNVVRLA
jgi:HAD superfamily hydrolase (TIGR01490 family)